MWVRVDRVKRPLEASYSGPFLVVDKNEKNFVIELPSGRRDTVSIDRLKPFFGKEQADLSIASRKKSLLERSKTLVNETDDQLDDKTDAELWDTETDDDPITHIDQLPNHEKFARKIPFTTRSGRKVTFSNTNHVKLISRYGRSLPVPKR